MEIKELRGKVFLYLKTPIKEFKNFLLRVFNNPSFI
jgi:hypothetical protein